MIKRVLSTSKDYGLVLMLVQLTKQKFCNFTYTALTYTMNDKFLEAITNTYNTVNYAESELQSLLTKLDDDVVLFFRLWLETHSYTYSYVLNERFTPYRTGVGHNRLEAKMFLGYHLVMFIFLSTVWGVLKNVKIGGREKAILSANHVPYNCQRKS